MALQLQSAEPAPPSGPTPTLNEADVQSLWELAAQDETEAEKLKRAARELRALLGRWDSLWDKKVAKVMLNVLKKHIRETLASQQTEGEGALETAAAPVARDSAI